jgi:hypothetical protein
VHAAALLGNRPAADIDLRTLRDETHLGRLQDDFISSVCVCNSTLPLAAMSLMPRRCANRLMLSEARASNFTYRSLGIDDADHISCPLIGQLHASPTRATAMQSTVK